MTLAHWFLPFAALSLSGWLYLLVGRSGFWRAAPKADQAPPTPLHISPDVVAVVPARNEAAYVGRALRSLIDQDYAGRLTVVLVDDHSEDATREIARAVQATVADRPSRALEVIDAGPLPAGWSGKLWAVSEGLRHAQQIAPRARYLWLADADIAHHSGSLRCLVARAEANGLDLASLMVRLHCERLWERLLIPPFVFFFQKLYPFPAVNRRERREAAAAGGCMLVRRTALARAGGIEGIRDRLIDDVALARRIKHHPAPGAGRIWLGLTERTESLRSQSGLREVWAMVARTADTQLGHSRGLLCLTVAGMLVLYLAPPLAVAMWPVHGDPDSAALGLVAWLCMGIAYRPTVRLYGMGAHWSLTLPLAAVFYTAMTIDSALQYRRGRGGRWKGRVAAPMTPQPQREGSTGAVGRWYPSHGLYPGEKSVIFRRLDE